MQWALPFLAAAAVLAAQARPQPQQGRPQAQPPRAASQVGPGESAQALYWREEFVYPVEGRRNPFVNLARTAELGPDFGVIYRPGRAVATLLDRSAQKRYRVRRGDVVGNAEVIEIRSNEVVFNVTVFGVSRVETLRVRKKEKEG